MARSLLALALDAEAELVGVYAATGSEADPLAFATAWLDLGGRIAYPRVVAPDRLGFFAIPPDDLEPGYRGILEPPAGAPAVHVADLDLLVVPGVGFDRRGGRLGQGGGFYDRLLRASDLRAPIIGYALALQVLPAVPASPHDHPVDVVLTERGAARAGVWKAAPADRTPDKP